VVRFQDGIAQVRPIAKGYVRRHPDFMMGTSSSEKERVDMKERMSGNSGGVYNGPIVTRRYSRRGGLNAQM